jgi:GT2 family glycosyltransferase
MEKVTVVFTSCGRLNLLKETVNSFLEFNTYPIEEYIIIENSGNSESIIEIKNIFKNIENINIIFNETNIGQVSSIDKAYSFVKTDYIFHCEDDWKFINYGFIEKSMDILKEIPNICNINIRKRNDGTKGSFHPTNGPFILNNGTIYHLYQQNHQGVWHGFSWNPGLRRYKDYELIKPYKKYTNEQGVNQKMKELNFFAACLDECYCIHIGENSVTPNSNR